MVKRFYSLLKKIGVETGGSNVQFDINPKNGRMVIIEIRTQEFQDFQL